MTASVQIKGIGNLAKMGNIWKDILEEGSKQLMADIMLEVVRLTNKGMNAYNVPFIPYAKKTVQIKIKTGRKLTPNMQQSSAMLSSLTVTRFKTKMIKYKLGVQGSHEGVSNRSKLAFLKDHKNYTILLWTPHYKKMAEKHFDRLVKRYIKSVS